MEILQGVNKSLQSYLVNQPNKNALQECDNTTRSLVQYFIAFYLRSKLDHALLAGLPRDYLIPPQNPTDLQNLIAKLCFEMEDNNGHFFDALPAKLAITEETLKSTFLSISKEIINDGMNWGRIISLFTFSGVLSRYFIEKKKPILVVETAALLTDFINEHVMIWINANGGWVRRNFYFHQFLLSSCRVRFNRAYAPYLTLQNKPTIKHNFPMKLSSNLHVILPENGICQT